MYLTPNSPPKGFTLIELMAALAVLIILVAIAIPNFQSWIANQKSRTQASHFNRSLHYARQEAIKRGLNVAVCPKAANTSSCQGGAWQNGWLIFTDNNRNGIYDSASDILLWEQPAMESTTSLSPAQTIIYNSTGFLVQGAGNYTLLATGCSGLNSYQMNIGSSGRIAVTKQNCP